MEIRFHCDVDSTFPNGQPIRAFLYTDYRIRPHTHDFYEMNIIFGGSGTHCIENARVQVCVGDVFVIPPMTVHAYENTENLDVYHVLLQRPFVDENRQESASVPGFVQLMEIEPFLRKQGSAGTYLHLSAAQLMQLKEELAVLEGTGAEPLKKHTAWKMLYALSALLQTQHKPHSRHGDAVAQALEFIHGHLGEKLTIDDLCRRVFLSRATFLRSFGSICGCTPMQYLTRCRIKQAARLLEEGRLSKTEVAQLCGFYDLSHMDRAMKKG